MHIGVNKKGLANWSEMRTILKGQWSLQTRMQKQEDFRGKKVYSSENQFIML